jgi:quinol-cytochrome oxidoreductase complex cytochrome b subunit
MMFLMVVASCLVGWFAQTKRNRPAALWAGLVFFVGIGWLSYMGLGITGANLDGLTANAEERNIFMDIIVGVLPPTAVAFVLLMVMKKPAEAAST